jgi:hypothetical protein
VLSVEVGEEGVVRLKTVVLGSLDLTRDKEERSICATCGWSEERELLRESTGVVECETDCGAC